MPRRRGARELELDAAGRPAPPVAPAVPGVAGGEALAMLARRGLRPRLAKPDVPFPRDLEGPLADRLSERLGHYGFRLFLRGAIALQGPFRPGEATRYLDAAQSDQAAAELVELGLALRATDGRVRLRWKARSFGGTLEWWVARELRRRLAADVAAGRAEAPRRLQRDCWTVAPGLYAVNARQDLVTNLCLVIADGLHRLSPEPP